MGRKKNVSNIWTIGQIKTQAVKEVFRLQPRFTALSQTNKIDNHYCLPMRGITYPFFYKKEKCIFGKLPHAKGA